MIAKHASMKALTTIPELKNSEPTIFAKLTATTVPSFSESPCIQMARATTAEPLLFKLPLSNFAGPLQKDESMIRMIAVSVLLLGSRTMADERSSFALAAPADWGGETIRLPPGFAADMKLTGVEHIRFAPGMMQPKSGSFFCYAFAFELAAKPDLTKTVVHDEFLRYYSGLCTAVLRGQVPDLDVSKFTLKLQQSKSESTASDEKNVVTRSVTYDGTLDWVEPFATKKAQMLHLEIQTWSDKGRNYIFACVSPQAKDAEIWKQLHKIRDDYLQKTKGSQTPVTDPKSE